MNRLNDPQLQHHVREFLKSSDLDGDFGYQLFRYDDLNAYVVTESKVLSPIMQEVFDSVGDSFYFWECCCCYERFDASESLIDEFLDVRNWKPAAALEVFDEMPVREREKNEEIFQNDEIYRLLDSKFVEEVDKISKVIDSVKHQSKAISNDELFRRLKLIKLEFDQLESVGEGSNLRRSLTLNRLTMKFHLLVMEKVEGGGDRLLPDELAQLIQLQYSTSPFMQGNVVGAEPFEDSMLMVQGISRDIESLMFDLPEFNESVPFEPGPLVWEAILSGCRIHGHMDLAVQAANKLFDIMPQNDGVFFFLFCLVLYVQVGH